MRLHTFGTYSKIFENTLSTKSIIVGDSLCPMIARHTKNAGLISKQPGESSLWKSGIGVKWLKNAVDSYPVSPLVENVVISIGSNGGFNLREDIPGLVSSLRKKFPKAQLMVIQGCWGWGGNKNVGKLEADRYYQKFFEQGVRVIEPAVGYSATDKEAHTDRPVIREISKVVDSIVLGSGGAIKPQVDPSVTSPGNSSSSPHENIISRTGDPYKYKVVNDHWLAKRDDQSRWFEITGSDFKPQFQSSIDILDEENPSARTKNAPKRSGTSVTQAQSNLTSSATAVAGSGLGKDPKVEDPSISKEFEFFLIPDGKGTNYRSAQMTVDTMKKMLPKYGIKNVVRFNGRRGKAGDDKHSRKHPATSVEAEEQLLKEMGINFFRYSSTRNQKEVNELLSKGNTLVHCAHGMDRTGGNVGGYLYSMKPNPNLVTTDQIWKYTTDINTWDDMALKNPTYFTNGGFLDQAKKFGVRDLKHAQELSKKY